VVADTSGDELGGFCLFAHTSSHGRWTCVRRIRGIYVAAAMFWLWIVDGVAADRMGHARRVCVRARKMSIIMFSRDPAMNQPSKPSLERP